MRHAKSTPASSNDESTGPLSLQDRFDKLANRHRLTEPTTPLHSSMGVSASNTSSSIQVKENAESALQDFSTAPLTGTRTSKASSSGRSHGFNYINDRLGLDAAGPRIKPATGKKTSKASPVGWSHGPIDFNPINKGLGADGKISTSAASSNDLCLGPTSKTRIKERIAAHAKNLNAIARTNNLGISPEPTQLNMWATVTPSAANTNLETAQSSRRMPVEKFSDSSFTGWNPKIPSTKIRSSFGPEAQKEDIAPLVVHSLSKRTDFTRKRIDSSTSDVRAEVTAGITTRRDIRATVESISEEAH